jgi:integrase
MQLLVETDIETGLRWGELTELRVKDLDFETSVLTIARGVVHLSGKGGGNGPRFLVKDYPKDKQWRHVKIPRHLVDKIKLHVARHGLALDELLFQLPVTEGSRRRTLPETLPDPETLGLTEPNEQGRQYPHGTLTAYQMGKCRCRHCKNAIAAYRATRRAAGIDQPRKPRSVNTDGHISGDWFRNHVWDTALEKADLGFRVTPHGLRHAHASWLLAGGADLQVVKERLGHGSLNTTGLYLHTLPGAGDAALKAMESYRASASTTAEEAAAAKKKAKKKSKKKQQGELAELKLMMAQMKDAMEAMRPGA